MAFNNNSYKPLWSVPSAIKPKAEKVKSSGGSKLKERAKLRKEAKASKEGKLGDVEIDIDDFKPDIKTSPKSTPTEVKSEVREPKIVAVSQSSRFHSATLVTLAKEIDLQQVTISVDDKELLSDTKLLIKAGTRYGLIGRNGVGKTTLFKVLVENTLVGLPTNLRILSIQQLVDTDEKKTIIEAVLEADVEAIQTIRESEALNKALNVGTGKSLNISQQDTERTAKVVGELLNRRDFDEMEKARRTAIHRSGKRGLEARSKALELEQKYKDSQELLLPDNQAKLVESITTDMINGIISEVFEKLALVDVDQAKSKATTILLGLGFKQDQLNSPVLQLSGGWRMRVALAKALFYAPDLLLMDEPTNHLDLKAIKWLTNYLIEEFPVESSVVVISHDRHFLNEVSQEIIAFKDNKLTYHPGNYDVYEQASYDLRLKKERMQASIDRRKKHYQASIDKAVKFAKSSGDDKRLGMVASRKKRLEKMGMMKTDDGKRFRQSSRVGYFNDYKQQVELEKKEVPITLPIPDPDPLRSNGSLIHLDNVRFRYPDDTKDTLSEVNLTVQQQDRIALIGDNGSGKSTVMKLLTGDLLPTQGKVERHPNFQFAYFGQHSIDKLDTLDPKTSAVTNLIANHPGLTEPEARQWLGAYQISGKLATNPIHTLSGGQKVRFVLADLLLEGPNLLLLDEVTNHLDLLSVEALALSLNEFQGAVVVISHDRWFLESVGTTSYKTSKGTLKKVPGK